MTIPLTIERDVHFRRVGKGSRRTLSDGAKPPPPPKLGRVPRVARLMALALRFEQYHREGQVTNQTDLAELGHVTRARISQIMNLLNLAPDIQEALLFLPLVETGRDPIHLHLLQSIASTIDWRKQRRQWRELANQIDQQWSETLASSCQPGHAEDFGGTAARTRFQIQ